MRRRSQTFYRIFISYIAILIIPMSILGIINYNKSVEVVKENIKKDNLATLAQAVYILDTRIQEINNLSKSLSMDQDVINLLNSDSKDKTNNVLLSRKVMDSILKYNILNDFIEDVYIYSKNSESIISSSGLYSLEMFYNNLHKDIELTYEQWLDDINQNKYQSFNMKTISRGGDDKIRENILYTHSLPNIYDNQGCTLIYIDKNKFTNIFSDVIKMKESFYFIIDNKGEIISSNDEENMYESYINDSNYYGKESIVIGNKKNEALMLQMTSDENGWRYVAVIPSSTYLSELNSVKINTIIIILICAIIGGIVSLIVTSKNYGHIEKITRLINKTYGSEYDKVDEYQLITNVLQHSYTEITSNRKMLENKIPLIKQSYLRNLLYNSSEIEKIKLEDDIFAVNIDYKKFLVLTIKRRDVMGSLSEENNTLIKFAIQTLLEEWDKSNFRGYALEIEENMVAYICCSNEDEPSKFEKVVYKFSEEIQQYINEKFHILISIGIGNVYENYEMINKSFQESIEAVNYGIFNQEAIIKNNNIVKNDKLFSISIQTEIQLANYIKSGKKKQAIEILDSLYKENCSNRKLTKGMSKLFIYNLCCIVVKVLGEVKLENSDKVLKLFNDEKINSKSIVIIFEDFKKLISNICDELESQKKNGYNDLKNKILEYIEGNYTSNQISLNLIADSFGITPQYLSKFFRENVGINYVDYINEKRVNKAKEYLEQNEKVKDVAVKAGFDNIGTFINAFKKHAGMTPGEYKTKMGI